MAQPSARQGVVPNGQANNVTDNSEILNSQYSIFGEDYVPAPTTVKQLPSGIYSACYKFFPNRGHVHVLHPMGSWISDKLLDFKDNETHQIVDDINGFWSMEGRYKELDLVFKRGYLLYGEPGTGKSSIINLVSQKIVALNGIVWYVENLNSLLELLGEFRRIEPNRQLLVIVEDIDSMLNAYPEAEGKMLSALDGELTTDKIVFIATTNHPEVLDKRLCNRPNRFDRIIKIKAPNESMRKEYMEFKGVASEVVDKNRNKVDLIKATAGLTISHLRELIVAVFILKEDPTEVIERLKSMRDVLRNSGDKDFGFKKEGE